MDLRGSLVFLRWGLAICTFMVAIGLVLEYKATLKSLLKIGLKFVTLRSTSFDRCIFGKLLRHSIGAILVTIGVAGELVFESFSFSVDRQLMAESDQTVTSLQRSNKQLGIDLEGERQETARMQERAEDEATARLKLQAQLAARRVSRVQMEQVALFLKPFTGKTVHLGVVNGTVESDQFWEDLAHMFTSAGILVVNAGSATHQGPAVAPFVITSGDVSMPFARSILSAPKVAKILDPSDKISVVSQGPGIDEVNISVSRKGYP